MALPFFGNLLIIKKLSKKCNGLPNTFMELSKQYQTDVLSLTMSGNYSVVVQGKELIDAVFNGDVFQARPNNFFIKLRSMGARRGITMTDGPLWKEQRAFAFKHLHEHGLGTPKMNSMLQRQLQEMLSKLEDCELSNFVLKQYVSKCVLNVLWEMVTGSSFQDEKTMTSLISLMEARSKAFDLSGGLLSQFPWIRFLFPNYSGFNLIKNLNRKFKEMITEIINYHKNTFVKGISRDFIDDFLHEMYENPTSSFFTDEQLVMVCLDFFIGGSQTISGTLDFCFLYMTSYQDVQEKVQKELDALITPGQLPSRNDKNKCPFVEAVISEVLRKAPVTPILGPRRTTANTFLNGYFIPKDTTVFLNIKTIHESSKHWEDPSTFKPERFLDEEGTVKQEQTMYNFGRGKRRCPAEVLARTALFVLFSGVLHNFKLQPVNEKDPPSLREVPGITASAPEYYIKLTRRHK
ncbi:probable cytochrome P450 305a1 isoform X2 [Halyomorpha halys]